MNIIIIGANGQLGHDLLSTLSSRHTVTGLTHSDIEIADINSVHSVFSTLKPEVVINTAAFHNVPKCEQEPELAFKVNAYGALNLARVCEGIGSRLIHYSTDYVFDGSKRAPYEEIDLPNPLSVYGNTKLSGEHFVLNYCENSSVIRVSGIYGKAICRAKGGNFVSTMIKLANEKPEVRVVTDEILTPTSTSSIAKNTAKLIEKEAKGLYHMSCEGEVSWYEFARTIWDTLKLSTPLYPAKNADFPSVVKRPCYSVLENKRLKELGIYDMPNWKDALIDFLKNDLS